MTLQTLTKNQTEQVSGGNLNIICMLPYLPSSRGYSNGSTRMTRDTSSLVLMNPQTDLMIGPVFS